MPAVNPEILRWARKTAELSLDEAARALGFNDARGQTAAERLADLERGDNSPSRPQLLRMSQRYRRPLLIFYLSRPPEKGDRGQDFRTLPGAQPSHLDPNLDALIRDVSNRQSLVRSLLEDDESPALSFVGSATLQDDVHRLAERISENLEFSRNSFRKGNAEESAFTYLRERIESVGIFVLLMGNLGTHHTNIPVEAFRGFAIADEVAPFAIVNDQDARTAWPFTALHEVVHIWLGATGISGDRPDHSVEQFCNDVAGEILLPSSDLLENLNSTRLPFEELKKCISEFAQARCVSRSMVAYKLLRERRIEHAVWRRLADTFREEWVASKPPESRVSCEAKGGGQNHHIAKRHRLGKPLVGLVRRALGIGSVTHTKASQILGVNPGNVSPLVHGSPNQG